MTIANAHVHTYFVEQLDAFMCEISEQVILSQRYCVDWLLDLYNSTTNVQLRRLICRDLIAVAPVNAVRACDMHDRLAVLGIAAELESVTDGSRPSGRGGKAPKR